MTSWHSLQFKDVQKLRGRAFIKTLNFYVRSHHSLARLVQPFSPSLAKRIKQHRFETPVWIARLFGYRPKKVEALTERKE